MKKVINLLIAVMMMGLMFGSRSSPLLAQTDITCDSDVVVQADDWLSKIADKTLGDVLAFQAIADATNAKAATDNSYATIANVDVIEPGWKLCIPSAEEAGTLLEAAKGTGPVAQEGQSATTVAAGGLVPPI